MLGIFLLAFAFSPGCRQEEELSEPEVSLYLTESEEKVTLGFEEYVAGVVAAEMEPTWPGQALGAQAILARTFARRKIQNGGARETYGTDLSDDEEEFQAYDPDRVNDAVRQAVEDTRGMIITYGGDPALTWFHAASGGRTCSPQEGLDFHEEETPYIKSVDDVPGADPKEWTARLAKEDITRALEEMGHAVDSVDDFSIAKKGDSGRAVRLSIGGEVVSAPGFRVTVGAKEMRSTLLEDIRAAEDKVVLYGRGFGHGVGMAQEGARVMAEEGRSAEEIIHYYYRDVEIKKIWE